MGLDQQWILVECTIVQGKLGKQQVEQFLGHSGIGFRFGRDERIFVELPNRIRIVECSVEFGHLREHRCIVTRVAGIEFGDEFREPFDIAFVPVHDGDHVSGEEKLGRRMRPITWRPKLEFLTHQFRLEGHKWMFDALKNDLAEVGKQADDLFGTVKIGFEHGLECNHAVGDQCPKQPWVVDGRFDAVFKGIPIGFGLLLGGVFHRAKLRKIPRHEPPRDVIAFDVDVHAVVVGVGACGEQGEREPAIFLLAICAVAPKFLVCLQSC